MKRLAFLLLAASASTSALAQHTGHGASPPPPAGEEQDPHAGHGVQDSPPAQPVPEADAHAGHQMPAEQPPPDPHAGHSMPQPPQPAPTADPHAGHQMDSEPPPAPPVGPPPPEALSGPTHAADAVFGPGRMEEVREETRAIHGAMRFYRFSIDQLEVALRDGREGFAWEDVQFWYGGDIDKLWLKSEGEGELGEGLERGEIHALWSHALDPWFDLQAGARLDFGPGPERPHLVLGVQGLAPYWFEIDAAAFLSSKGDLAARFEGEYDWRLTQRLILQPRVELDLSLQDVPELRIGSGISSAEAGLRLRYEIVPEFAPYVGVEYERAFGNTADFRRADGDDAGGWSLLMGMRAWF